MSKFVSRNTLLCFSPPVMLATIIIEVALAAWVAARYTLNSSRRIIVLLLILLAAFQLAEYNVCTQSPEGVSWSKLGYIFITFLPPLGLHLISKLSGRSMKKLLAFSYGAAVALVGTIVLAPEAINTGICGGNYVIFHLTEPLSYVYAIFYMGLLAEGVYMSSRKAPKATKSNREALGWLCAGYIAFLIPTFFVEVIVPETHFAIPSIMCGFAVTLAGILGLKVAPPAKN